MDGIIWGISHGSARHIVLPGTVIDHTRARQDVPALCGQPFSYVEADDRNPWDYDRRGNPRSWRQTVMKGRPCKRCCAKAGIEAAGQEPAVEVAAPEVPGRPIRHWRAD